MRFTTWATVLAIASGALLSACGSGGGSSSANTNVRLLNASVGYASLDMTVDSKSVNSAVAYGSVGSYASISTSATATQVLATGAGTTLTSSTPTLAGDSNYAVIAYGWQGAVRTQLLQETEANPDSGKSKLLVLNLAADAGALDVYLTSANDSLDNATPLTSGLAGGSSSGYNTINSGTYRVRLTGYGNKADLRLDIPSITLDSATVQSLIVTATPGGNLVNAMLAKQQGAVAKYDNGSARVRVIAALPASATVVGNVTAGGVKYDLLNAIATPIIGGYKTAVDPTGATVKLTVNGIDLPVTTPTLAKGGDYSVLVWGEANAPKVSLLTDNNRLPTIAGTSTVRVINAMANLNAGISLTADFSSVLDNVDPGTQSGLANLVSTTTASNFSLSSPLSAVPIWTASLTNIPQGGVYVLYAMGSAEKPVVQLKKER
ncbi:DUF4397 domain-containing protein [Paucibacter sp. APW11]|uniref:DUF4397 domain-containing protein n=1 Tax=Roseateles aquae TaxID=3077235 RepID=A0ABU3PGB4_9BURK|nr:DUF4397 domain-containing protein [Paucibacter sp. APW11]MDT9001626.1 DUF4397 domain-containing protein [Paucibacter sp. APW11]